MSQATRQTRRGSTVIFVVILVLAQALALLVNAILTVLDPESQNLPGPAMFFLAFLFVLGAVWLIAAARGVYQGKAWPRGALVVAEVLAVIVSFTYFQLGDIGIGVALVASGGLILIGLFTPALNKHLVKRRSQMED